MVSAAVTAFVVWVFPLSVLLPEAAESIAADGIAAVLALPTLSGHEDCPGAFYRANDVCKKGSEA